MTFFYKLDEILKESHLAHKKHELIAEYIRKVENQLLERSMPKFSKSSIKKLKQCHPYLQLVIHKAIQYFDFKVTCGYRGKVEQDKVFKSKKGIIFLSLGLNESIISLI